MEQSTPRYQWSIILTHWILSALIIAALAVGWYGSRVAPESAGWIGAFNLHISLGITSAIFAILLLILRLVHKAPPYSSRIFSLEAVFARSLHWLLYIAAVLMPISGYLQAVYAERRLQFWTLELPAWGHYDAALSELWGDTHSYAFYGLTVLILFHLSAVIGYAQLEPGFIRRMLPALPRIGRSLVPPELYNAPSRKTKRLARSFLVFGWAGFGLQLSIVALSVLLLLFAGSGSLVNPVSVGTEFGIFWANCGIVVLVFTAFLSFYFTRAGKKLASASRTNTPYSLVAPIRLLRLGILASLVGLVLALLGAGLSINVFISKVVSQPPGIAITDPEKIIRALDVFVLLANFTVIAGHVAAITISLWLLRRTHRHQATTERTPWPVPPSEVKQAAEAQ